MSETTIRKTQGERRETAEAALLRAATALLAQRGYDGFSLAEVGEAAGYSRGLPAHYFGSKGNLLAASAERVIADYQRTTLNLPPATPGLPRLTATIRHHARQPQSDARRALVLLLAEAPIRPELRETINRLNDEGIARLSGELRAGIAAGTIRPDVDVEEQARVIYAYLRGQMLFTTLDPGFASETLCETFLAMLEHALRP